MCAREAQFRLTVHKNHGAEDFRGGRVMREPQVPVFPSLAQEESPRVLGSVDIRRTHGQGLQGAGTTSCVPPPWSSSSQAELYMSQRPLGPAWPCVSPQELKCSVGLQEKRGCESVGRWGRWTTGKPVRLLVCACVYGYKSLCMCVCTCVYIHVCMFVYVCMCMGTCVYLCLCVRVCSCVCDVHACICTCVHVCVCVHVYMCMGICVHGVYVYVMCMCAHVWMCARHSS